MATPCEPVASPTGCFGDPDDGSDGACDSPCQPGYNANTRTPGYTCDTNGDWTSGSLVCTAKVCQGHPYSNPTGTAAQDGDPHINCDQPVMDNRGTFGTQCNAICTVGYEKTSGSAVYTCKNVQESDTGYWYVFAAFPSCLAMLDVCHRCRDRGGGSLVCTGKTCKSALPGSSADSSGVNHSQPCTEGQYRDSGDPDHKFTGSTCQTDPTTPNPDGNNTPNAMCKDGYQETGTSEHNYMCDHDGHWVVQTGGEPLQCTGQLCPDNGQTPHDGDCNGNGACIKTWPYTNFEPCYMEHSGSQRPSVKTLYYSDACNSTDHEAWGDDCHCSSSCVEGYSEDGTVNGTTDRTFRCLQENNKPYFEPKQPLTCKAITCGNVMDTVNHTQEDEGNHTYALPSPVTAFIAILPASC